MKQTTNDKTLDELERLYNSNLDQLEHLDDTGFDYRTKTGIRAYIDKYNKVIRGMINYHINHQTWY